MSFCVQNSPHGRFIPPPKIQIVVNRVGDSGTDIQVSTTMTRETNYLSRNHKLPPLILPGDTPGDRPARNRLLSPGRPIFRTRSPSPAPRIGSGSENTLNTLGKPGASGGGTRSRTPTLLTSASASVSNRTPSMISLPASPTSRFHHGCIPPEVFPQFTANSSRPAVKSKVANKPTSFTRRASMSSTSHLSCPGKAKNSIRPQSGSEPRMPEPAQVESYLKSHPIFLSNYVQKYVDESTLHEWIEERNKGASGRKLSLSRWRFGNGAGEKCTLLKTLVVEMNRSAPEANVLWELSVCVSSAISASSFVLYLFDAEQNHLRRFSPLYRPGSSYETFPMEDGATLATYVCRRREPMRISRKDCEEKFPEGLGDAHENLEASCYILCHPVIKSDGELVGVVEFHRQDPDTPFYKEDEEIVGSYLVWGGIALHYAEMNSIMNKQKQLSDFLFSVVRSIFQDMVQMDAVVKKVMKFAQSLVDADRASLFLVDNKTKELYARIFDVGSSGGAGGSGAHRNSDVLHGPGSKERENEIRFPMTTGIAGHVATTASTLNIVDAYNDHRFNRNVDQQTGYVTKSILCMPVKVRGSVIGVVQMVNKKRGLFTKEDEESFQVFAVYCGLALHHAKLYEKIRRSEQKYKVALEVLSYHNTCTEEEFQAVRPQDVNQKLPGIDDYYFKTNAIDGLQKAYQAVFMFGDLFGWKRFDADSLIKFVLTVKKNYRSVPYHNWSHGWSVANAMYCILKRTDKFRVLECVSLFVACLCHDLDHRGKNNKFMLESASPLAAIYSTSTMEHHHFNQTVTILQCEGHNIFSRLGSDEFKQVLGNIKHCILATDLALFFINKAKLEQLIENNSFSWGNTEHRLLIQAIAMTASDLCASSKPWDIQYETVKVIFEEFYEQGDLEKRAGRIPIPMMDRNRTSELPQSQVSFLNGICIPCYELLRKILPETEPFLDGCKANLKVWQDQCDKTAGHDHHRHEHRHEHKAGSDH